MKKILTVLFLVTFISPIYVGSVAAQEQSTTGVSKIAVISIDAIRRDSMAVKSIREQIETFRNKFQVEIQKEEDVLREANQALARQRTLLSAEAFDEKRREFEKQVATIQRLVQEKKLKLDQSQGGAMNKVQDKLNEIVSALATENNINLILSKDQTILAVKSLDITGLVLERLDKQLPELKVTAPAE
ncbi:MAG: OmpH family outer membrane protein [Rhodospirillaceae bacterium]|nr:OmpH family outer membrane protein [Rhodospirillaceae bacterium]